MVDKRGNKDETLVIKSNGEALCTALITGNACKKPIFVSVGHMIDLCTATRIVRACCVYRVPEPVRTADIHSRSALRTQELIEVYKTELLDDHQTG